MLQNNQIERLGLAMENLTENMSWNDILLRVCQLIKENEQLKAEKQQLVNENVNLKLELRKFQKSHLTCGLISEGRK